MLDAAGKTLETRLDFPEGLPPTAEFEPGIRRAPSRGQVLSEKEIVLALKNALRYIPEKFHMEVAPEFLAEYRERGRIYGYRFRPRGRIVGKPVGEYRGRCIEAKAFQVMIDNNLDFDVALYPYELVTYGETGQVCQNWMQYLLIKKYLEIMTQDQTLVLESGHPLGLFRSSPGSPRVILTNGLMVGLFDNQEDFARAAALGVANYGQMTAGGWMYIGPQGIVHGTYNTLLNAGRKKFDLPNGAGLAGHLFVSSGLGGMSGALSKAADMAGAVSIVADVDLSRIETRLGQGWVSQKTSSLDEAFEWAGKAMVNGKALSIAYHGNIVDLLQYAFDNGKEVELLSDQTS
jgi:urocanate hydratase